MMRRVTIIGPRLSRQHERGIIATWAGPDALAAFDRATTEPESPLPFYPGDLMQTCGETCRCHWEVETIDDDADTAHYASWIVADDALTCDACRRHGQDWQHRRLPSDAPR